jgi:Arc/MetJ family transcription regulator
MSVMDPPRGTAAKISDLAVVGGLMVMGFSAWLLPRFVEVTLEAEIVRLRIAVFVLCAFVAGLWILVRRLQRGFRLVDEMLADVLFGAGTKRDREAVDILVRALKSPDPAARESSLRMLRKISGLELGEDPKAWEEWWTVARATFTRPGPQPAKK